MPLVVNLRHMVDQDLSLKGELTAADLDLDSKDELVQVGGPLKYEIEAQRLEQSLLLRGHLQLKLDCQCVRCLKPLPQVLEFKDWVCDIPLAGEEAAPIVSDCVDLTPYLREDILLGLPQHPLCEPECGGLKQTRKNEKTVAASPETTPSVWADLDKLKL